jgi:hypothetical protein
LDSSPLFCFTNQHHQIELSTYCLPYLRKSAKTSSHYIFTLKMATAVFAEMIDNFQHSTQFIPKS